MHLRLGPFGIMKGHMESGEGGEAREKGRRQAHSFTHPHTSILFPPPYGVYICFRLAVLRTFSHPRAPPTPSTHTHTHTHKAQSTKHTKHTHTTKHAYHFTAIDCTSFDWSSSWLKIALQILWDSRRVWRDDGQYGGGVACWQGGKRVSRANAGKNLLDCVPH